jgi:hypothetical protein
MASAQAKQTLIELWGGWSIELPVSNQQRNEDGSWSAWGEDWTIDIHIIETAGDSQGRPVSADRMLGDQDRDKRTSGNGWIAIIHTLIERDNNRDVYRLAGRLASENTLMSCWISYLRKDQRDFAEALMHAVSHKVTRAV